MGCGNQRLLGPTEGVARGREAGGVILRERLGVRGFHEDEVQCLLKDFQRVDPDRRDDQSEVLVDLIRREGCWGRVTGDGDVVDLHDCGVEFGNVEGHGNL